MDKKIYLEFIKRVLTDTLNDDKIRNDFFESKKIPSEDVITNILGTPINPKRLGGLDWPERAHTMIGMQRLDNLHNCLDKIRETNIDGDIVETGVWRGGASIFAKVYCDLYEIDKKIFVVDSFEGLPVPEHPEDYGDKHHTIDFLKVSLDEVMNNFKLYGCLDENVIFLKGWFSDTLPGNTEIKNISILRMDGDMYKSTMDVFDSCYYKVTNSGIIIIDDYCLPKCKKAVEDFRIKNKITSQFTVIDSCGIFWEK